MRWLKELFGKKEKKSYPRCLDCKWGNSLDKFMEENFLKCGHPTQIRTVEECRYHIGLSPTTTEKKPYCEVVRSDPRKKACGPTGKFFEPKLRIRTQIADSNPN